MRALSYIFLFFALVTCTGAQVLAPLDQELKTNWPNNRTINVVFHGHSVPAGYHATPEVKPFESYPHLFRVKLKERYPSAVINVITTATPGEKSDGGAGRFTAEVLSHQPDLIFIDYALNDVHLDLSAVDAAWRSMITDAKGAGIPVVLMTPTGSSTKDLSDPADPLTIRADLIRGLALSENVLLAEVSGAWLAELDSGTPQSALLSQFNHPNLAGHTIATEALFDAYMIAATGGTDTVTATDFPRDSSTNTFVTSDSLLTFTTSNTFSGNGDFLGDSGGGTASHQNSWNGAETLGLTLTEGSELGGFGVRWTVSDIIITGFDSDPGATISTVNGNTGTAAWDEPSKTLTLDIPWDGGNIREIHFSNPVASNGKTLLFTFTDTSPGWQATFTHFNYIAGPPAAIITSFAANKETVPAAGTPVTLSWEVQDVTSLTLDPGSIDVTGYTTDGIGSYVVAPNMNTTYVLTGNGPVTSELAIQVPLSITEVMVNEFSQIEITAWGLVEGTDYRLYRSPDLLIDFSAIGPTFTGDSSGTGVFLDTEDDLHLNDEMFYRIK